MAASFFWGGLINNILLIIRHGRICDRHDHDHVRYHVFDRVGVHGNFPHGHGDRSWRHRFGGEGGLLIGIRPAA